MYEGYQASYEALVEAAAADKVGAGGVEDLAADLCVKGGEKMYRVGGSTAGLPLYCTVPRQLRKYAQLTRAMHPNTLFVRPVFNRSRPDGSSALACRVVPRRLSYSDVGTRFIVADSIRNLGQEERAVVMPHWNTRQTTSRNGYCVNHSGYQ